MTALIDYINSRENLLPLSSWITLGALIFIFLLLQLLGISLLSDDETVFKEKMEVREVIKLRFDKTTDRRRKSPVKSPRKRKVSAPHRTKSARKPQPQVSKPDVSKLLKDLQPQKTAPARAQVRRVSAQPAPSKSGITTHMNRTLQGFTANDFKATFRARPSTRPSGRRAVSGAEQSTAIEVGSVAAGLGNVADISGSTFSGRTGARATRSAGGAGTGATISLPVVDGGGGDATIDLHALIAWMKKHPGPIPKLVAHEMGHGRGDLSSRIRFSLNGKQYTIFLSCNETELLLRVCLVERDDFILLKDAGIKEKSHFLTIGDVVRQRNEIQSLISSRKAPKNTASRFYGIFWAWWDGVQK